MGEGGLKRKFLSSFGFLFSGRGIANFCWSFFPGFRLFEATFWEGKIFIEFSICFWSFCFHLLRGL